MTSSFDTILSVYNITMMGAGMTLLNDLRVGLTVAFSTLGAGVSTFLRWIPEDIGKLASLLGLVLTIFCIRYYSLQNKKLHIEITRMQKK